jgi:hypothetical protein
MRMMRTNPRARIVLILLPALSGGTAWCQQLAFTSRAYVQSPVVVSSVETSKDFGFDSVLLRNDGPKVIRAVHFQIALRIGAEDEVADQRRVPVSLEQRDSKRLIIGMAHIEGLKQLAKSRKLASALVILTVESVEFEDGGEWHQTERERGIPLDPAQPLEIPKRK